MTEDTVCNIASMTKAITGACASSLSSRASSTSRAWLCYPSSIETQAPATPFRVRLLIGH